MVIKLFPFLDLTDELRKHLDKTISMLEQQDGFSSTHVSNDSDFPEINNTQSSAIDLDDDESTVNIIVYIFICLILCICLVFVIYKRHGVVNILEQCVHRTRKTVAAHIDPDCSNI